MLHLARRVRTVSVDSFDTALPVRIQDGKTTLLWDARAVKEHANAQDSESYSCTPEDQARALLELHVNHETTASTKEADEFEWRPGWGCKETSTHTCSMFENIFPSERWVGGAMEKFAMTPVKELRASVRDDVTARLSASCELQFVYSFANMDTAFKSLTYINDAGHFPLQPLPENVFLARYGLDRALSFRPAEARARVAQNWWGVYE